VTKIKKTASKKKDTFLFNNVLTPVTRKRRKEQTLGKEAENATKRRKVEKTYAHQIRWSGLQNGDGILGVVKEIQEMDIKISLPNMKTGYCSIREVSSVLSDLIDEFVESEGRSTAELPSLSSLVQVGQVFHFVVLDLEKTSKNFQRIELTLREDLVNQQLQFEDLKQNQNLQCCIQSIEDRGFVISTGIEGARGFLKSKNRYSLGQTVNLSIKTIQKKQKIVIFEDCKLDTVEKCSKLTEVRPGQRVNVKISKVLANGLSCNFKGSKLVATVHATHMARDGDYSEGSLVQARVLFVSYATKALAITLLPHLVDKFKGLQLSIKAGSIQSATCVAVSLTELLLTLNDTGQDARCHINQISDEQIDKIDESEYLNKELKCRVLSTNILDGLVNVTLKESVLTRPLMFFADAKVGMQLSGKVIKVEERWVLVEISAGIRGAISQVLAGEIKHEDLRKKYKLEQKMEVTILATSPPKRLELTDKKAIVQGGFTRIEDYNVSPNTKSKGVVINVHEKGIKLLFFNKVFGYVSKEELTHCGYSGSSADHFEQGQVLDCRILASDAETKSMICTLNTDMETDTGDRPKEGSIVKVKVVGMGAKSIQCSVKSNGRRVKGILPFNLLSDHKKNASLLRESLKPKKTAKALVLQCMPNYMVLTLKPSLKQAVEKRVMPQAFEDVSLGKEYVGYVVSIEKIGVFVRFLGSLTGYSRRTECLHLFGKEPEDLFAVGQTVRARVTGITEESKRFRVTLRRDALQKPPAWLRKTWANSLFDEQTMAQSLGETNNVEWEKFKPGSKHKFKVTSEQAFGYLANFPEVDASPIGLALKPRQTVDEVPAEAIILDANQAKKIVDISFQESLSDMKPVKELPSNKKVTGVIELLKDGYMVLSISELNCLAFAPVSEPNVHAQARELFEEGQSVECRLTSVHSSGRLLASVDLYDLSVKHQIESAGTRKWDFFDSHVNCFTDLKKGVVMEVLVVSKTNTRLTVSLGPTVPIKGAVTKSRQLEGRFDNIGVGERLKAEVTKTPRSLNVKFIRLKLLKSKKLKVGKQYTATITGTAPQGLEIEHQGKKLFLPTMEISSDVDEVKAYIAAVKAKKPSGAFTSGKSIRVVVTGAKTCSAKQVKYDATDLKIGEVTMGQVQSITKDRGAVVHLPGNKRGLLHVTNVGDFQNKPLEKISVNDVMEVRVLAKDGKQSLIVSARHVANEKAPELIAKDLKVHDKVEGFIKAVTKKGTFITLSRHLDAFCMLREMVDGYVEELGKVFPVGMLVQGVVTKVDQEKERVTISLKKSMQKKQSGLTGQSLEVGQTYVGIINNVAKFGLFCTLKDTKLVGLVHTSKLPKEKTPLKDHYTKGQKVGVRVLDVQEKKIALVLVDSVEEDNIGPVDALPSKELMELAQFDEEADDSDSDDDSDEEFGDVPTLDVGEESNDKMEVEDVEQFMESEDDSSDDSESS